MTPTEPLVASAWPALRPRRLIEGNSAVLLPYTTGDQPDWESFRRLLDRTWTSGLTPAVNMDTGYVNLLTADERERVLAETAEVARGRRFIAGAFIEGEPGEPGAAYLRAIGRFAHVGRHPILFPCSALGAATEQQVLETYARVAEGGGPLLAFELGKMFAPFGRIYSEDFFRRLLDIDAFTGAKHSSLDRDLEWRRMVLRDCHRPEFRIYTGNDLAIDMVFYGSDYLLGLSAFAVDGFALRDRYWHEGHSRAVPLNDLLQYLGQLAFRRPVPAYKHSAAQFLKIRGAIPSDRPHPASPRRPDSDLALLQDIRERLDEELNRGSEAA